jgi:uncharacterized protein (DUF2147 family)
VLLALLLLSTPAGSPGTPAGLLGDWITPDKSIVQIYNCAQSVCIKIAHVDKAVGHSTDGLNPDAAKRNRPLCGLTIGTGFAQKDADHATGGKLYDPQSGHTYSGTLTLADNSTLKLHGFVGVSLFGRTEQWHRAMTTPTSCQL